MRCGHVADVVDHEGNHGCSICIQIGCEPMKAVTPWEGLSLPEGRMARCPTTKQELPSSPDLPFWEYREDAPYDIFYGGT